MSNSSSPVSSLDKSCCISFTLLTIVNNYEMLLLFSAVLINLFLGLYGRVPKLVTRLSIIIIFFILSIFFLFLYSKYLYIIFYRYPLRNNGNKSKAFERSGTFLCVTEPQMENIKITGSCEYVSSNFKYKKENSIVLIALVDHDYCFTYINVGVNGSASDGSIFKNCSIYTEL